MTQRISVDRMIPVTIYCDSCIPAHSPCLYSEEEIEHENLTEIDFPESIVRAWFREHASRYQRPGMTFEEWFRDAYTADDTDGLYSFAEAHGFTGRRWGKEVI